MASDGNAFMLEGFICPMCKSDLGTADNLLSHFQEEHSEDQDIIKTFKDLLERAKKKILKQDPTGLDGSFLHRKTVSAGFDSAFSEPQELGCFTSHKELFSKVRAERLTVPTNQLVIRLERLLNNLPPDPIKRKVHEQNIVPWIDGAAVPRCPSCAGTFNIARRQHHCRTCGSVMCHDCSHFIALTTARKIVDIPPLETAASEKTQHTDPLRVCVHCITLFEAREQRRESKKIKPIISQFYERLSCYKEQADKLSVEYSKMANSLLVGESSYNLSEAQAMKVKLLRLAENIEALSSKIAVLGKDSESPPEGRSLRLQTVIRSAFIAYLRNLAVSMPALPTEEELTKTQEKRRQEVAARIKEENMKRHTRNSSGATMNLSPAKISSSSSNSADQVSIGQGWVPENSKMVSDADDPLIQQMNIIRSYIKEAKAAHKADEVASLEANLMELKKEFWKMKQEDDAGRSGESSEVASLSGSYDDNVRTRSESLYGDSPSQ